MLARRFWPTALVAVAALLGAACAPAAAPPAAQPVSTQASAASPATAATGVSTAAPAAQTSGTLSIAITQPTGSLDPQDYKGNFVMMDLIYEPIVRYGQGGKIEPSLAESWEIAPDGKTYTFHIRHGVKFHDGTPLDAEAVRLSLSRWVGQKRHNFLPATGLIESYTAPDARTIVLKLTQPYYGLLQELSLVRPVRVLSPKALTADGTYQSPIGMGPMKFSEDVPGQRTVLVRNDDYWGPKPSIDKLVLQVIPDAQTRVAALEQGEVDVIGGEYLAAVPPSAIPALKAASAQGVNVIVEPGTTTLLTQFNFERAPFNDERVREAVNHVFDRNAINQALFAGTYTPADAMVPPTIPYAAPSNKALYSLDLDKARSLLGQAGWAPGSDGTLAKDGTPFKISLVLNSTDFSYAKALGEVMQAQLQKVGIATDIRTLDSAAYYDVTERADFDLVVQITYGAPYDPHSALRTWFYRDQRSGHGKLFVSDELDSFQQRIFASTSDAERTTLYQQLWKYVDDNAVAAPLLFNARVYATGKRVTGFTLAPTEYDLTLTGLTLSPQ